jgi:gliding motility-associated-like protein
VEIEEHAGQSFVWNGVTYTEECTYTQYFNNRYGCDSTVTLTLTFDGSVDPSFEPDTIPFGEADSLVIYLPNAITPTRNDGLNDYFCLPDAYKPLFSSFEISIFNRWGTRVYHATDKNFRWDGRINGKIFFNNVYNYRIDCLDIIGRPYILRGTITVL